MNLQPIIANFAQQVESLVRQDIDSRVRSLLQGALGKRGPGRPPGSGAKGYTTAKSAKPVSAKQARQRKIQGIYLGTIRHMTGANRAKVKAVAKEKGVAAAVAFSKTLRN